MRFCLPLLALAAIAASVCGLDHDAPSAPVAALPDVPEQGAETPPPPIRERVDATGFATGADRGDEEGLPAALAAVARALASGRDGPAAAAALRCLLRTDEAAFAEAAHQLLAADTEAGQRRVLALALGTIAHPDTDRVLLEALHRCGDDRELTLCLIAALGAAREPADEDDVFDLAAAPHFGFAGPGGIGITVHAAIVDPAVQVELGSLLLDASRPDVRLAAATALQFSLGHEACRARFLSALQVEDHDGTAGILAAALGGWAREHEGPSAQQIVQSLLLPADRAGFDDYRLRLETVLHGHALAPDARARVRSWTATSQPAELRAFALTLLARQSPVADADRALLEQALGDQDPPTRDLAARLLGGLPAAPGTIAVLRAVFERGAEWNVRSSALGSLAALLPPAAARELLASAARDGDPRIARRAERLRQRFGG